MASPQLRALIYNRVSADPAGRRISTASQDEENRAFCARQGWAVVDAITDDDRSASRYATKQREGYERVLSAIDGTVYGRIDVLVTWESSRGERKLDGYVELRDRLERNRVLLAYKGRVYDMSEGDDRFATGLDALLDEREAERARERTLRSHRASVQRGTPRGVVPYGYRREYDPHSGHMISQTIDPDTGPVVREIVARILGGDTLYQVAQDLNRRGVLTPRGHQDQRMGRAVDRAGWSSSMIRNVLSRHSLAGLRSHRGQVVREAAWPALVSPDEWARVQRLLKDPVRVRNDRGVEVRHLLSGVALCGPCGAWLRPLLNRGRMTYTCAGRTPTSGKGHVARSAAQLDAFVTSVVLQRLMRPDALDVFRPRLPADRGQEAERELAEVRARLAEFEESAARGGISPGAFERIEARLLGEIRDLEAQLVPVELPPVVREVAGDEAPQRWQALSLTKKRRLLRALCSVTVHRVTRAGVRGFDASSVEVTWLSPS